MRRPTNPDLKPTPTDTLLYLRVSSKKQLKEGDGIASQRRRLELYADSKAQPVINVYSDSLTGSEQRRPGLQALLAFLRSNRHRRFRVLFDHLDRWVRDTNLSAELDRAATECDAVLESPGIVYDGTSSSRLMKNMTVAFADYHRVNNAEQTVNRMEARLQNGFAVFAAPSGYAYGRVAGLNGRVLVPRQPAASVVVEALEGHASGRFENQADVQRFLEQHPLYPKPKNGRVPHQRVGDMLRSPIYAGYVESPKWGVERRKGHHEPLISYETFQRNQDRLNGLRMTYRTDLSQDFPLRGFVLCDDCAKPLTACWSISGSARKKRHPYYQCSQKGCASYGKTIRRDVIEGEFEAMLRTARPQPQLLAVATAMLKELWTRKQANAAGERKALKASLVEAQIDQAVERIIETSVPAVSRALEQKVQKLTSEKLLIAEKIEFGGAPQGDFERRVRTGLAFLANPSNLWATGRIEDRRSVLKLTFGQKLRYKRGEGFRTPDLTLPFKALADFSGDKMGMARRSEQNCEHVCH